MSSKTTSKTNQQSSQVNSLPNWLTAPYQAALGQAQQTMTRPAIGANTQQALNNLTNGVAAGTGAIQGAMGSLSGMAQGNFGTTALTKAANGDYLNPSVSGALSGFAANGGGTQTSGALDAYRNGGQPTAVSGALSQFLNGGSPQAMSTALNGFAANGGGSALPASLAQFAENGRLDTSYIADIMGGYRPDADTSYLSNSGLNRTAAGEYLSPDSNPFIKSIADRSASAAQARINSQFGSAGRSNGSGLYAKLFGEGIANASNDVYANNFATERQLQQQAQGTLLGAGQNASEASANRLLSSLGTRLGAESAARENALSRQFGAGTAENANLQAALGRQYGAAGSIFGAENQLGSEALARQYGASTAQFGAENAANENAAGRQYGALSSIASGENAAIQNALARQQAAATNVFGAENQAQEAERTRQQAAASGLLSSQLGASSQLPGLLSSMVSGQQAAVGAGQFEDQAEQLQLARYLQLLTQIASPFGMSNGTLTGTNTQKTSGLGNALNVWGNFMGNMASAAGGA